MTAGEIRSVASFVCENSDQRKHGLVLLVIDGGRRGGGGDGQLTSFMKTKQPAPDFPCCNK